MRKIAPFIPLAAVVALAVNCAEPATPPPVAPPPAASAAPAAPPGPAQEKVSLESVGLDGSAIDHSVDPCQDFYQFACGDWIKKTKIPGDRSRWVRSFNVINKKNQLVLRKILKEAEMKRKDEDPALTKLGDYYASCMDEKAVEKAGLKPIKPLLDKAKRLGSVQAVSALVTELHKDGIWALFDVSSDQDFKDATRYITYLDQDGLGLPDRDYYTKQDDKSKEIREKYQDHVAAMMTLAGWNKHAAEQAAKDVMEVETDLAQISKTKVERRDPKSLYNPVDRDGVKKLAAHFEWDRYFEGLGFPKIKDINVTSKKFFSGMDELLGKVSMPKWRNYFSWQIINATAPALPKKFVDEDFKMRQVLTGQKEQKPRWKRCVSSTDAELGELLAQPFVKERFGGDSKAFALKLVHAIGKAFVKDVGTLDWMDPATKQRAREKFEAMAYLIGYPDKWKKYPFKVDPDDYAGNLLRGEAWEVQRQLKRIGKPVDRGEWEMTPPTVNAYYTAQKNQMVFPAGILQPPFYDVKATIPVNLGAMGMVVGHELTHGFDDEGSQFDKKGNLEDWWTPEVKKQFKAKTGCIVDEYSKYEAVPGVHVNGKLTLGENIADNGGIKLAYSAFKTLRGGAKTVKVADGFTEDQQFFLATGQIWCSKQHAAIARMLAQVDPHSPPHYRVNGSLSNLPAFAQAFSCKVGTPMHPKNTCSVW